jgi:hypothetical protein
MTRSRHGSGSEVVGLSFLAKRFHTGVGVSADGAGTFHDHPRAARLRKGGGPGATHPARQNRPRGKICYSVKLLKIDTILDTAEFYGGYANLFCRSPSYE